MPEPSAEQSTPLTKSSEAGPERPFRAGTTEIKSRGTVTIDAAHCKGCDLCIPACPPAVLTMSTAVNHMGYRYPELAPGCTGCAACLYVCPDFVFEVFRFETPVITFEPSAESPTSLAKGSEAGPERPIRADKEVPA